MLSRVGLVLALWLTLVGAAQAADLQVTRNDDPVPDACAPTDCSLREALGAAQDGDRVLLGGSGGATRVHELMRGGLVVTQDITIAGSSAGFTGVDGTFNGERILEVAVGAAVTLRDVSLTGGRSSSGGPDTFNGGGHAILNRGVLTVERAVFTANGGSSRVGGAIGNHGTLTVRDTDFHANTAYYGGGIGSHAGVVTIERSTFREGVANGGGAGLYLRGGSMTITNSTVAANGSFGPGGGIVNAGGSLSLVNDTFVGNVNGSLLKTGGTTSVRNTILAGPGPTCEPGAVTDNFGGNLDVNGSCGFGPPRELHLAPLADNGGATPTAALLFASEAIDGGVLVGCPLRDQRGELRSGCDSGAFEAVKRDAPTATTLEADAQRFVGSAHLAGEAGVLYFQYRPTETGDWERTPGIGLGVVDTTTTRNEPFPSLTPGTSYEYRAVAENATARAEGAIRTLDVPPVPGISRLHRLDVSDTSATLRFTLDPRVAGAHYEVLIDGQPSPRIPISGSGPRTITRTVTGLQPDTLHELQIVATNWGGTTAADDGKIEAQTLPRYSGAAGTPLMTEVGCPGDAQIDWGDGMTSSVPCSAGELTLDHTYAAGGRYRVRFAYAGGVTAEGVAVIAPASSKRLLSVSVNGAGRVTGNGIDCPGVCHVELPANEPVALTADGADFQGWAETCQGTGACAFELSEHRHVGADFGPAPEPPGVGEVHVGERTDTTGRIGFLLDANGVPTTYRLVVNGTALAPVAAGSGDDAVALVHDLSGLAPGTRYDVQVIASNGGGEASDAVEFTTHERVHGKPGEPTRLVLTGTAPACPGPAQIDWGDSTVSAAVATCTGPQYRIEATHTYARADRYRITVHYDAWPEDTAFAVIAEPPAVEPVVEPEPTAVPTVSATPTPSPTPTPTPAPQPTAAVDVVAAPAGGTVLVKLPGTNRFVVLRPGQEIPYGTEIDTRKGRVTLTAVPRAGAAPETAVFHDGLFKISYVRGITNLTLSEPLAACKQAARASAAANKKAKSRKLWGKGKGSFRTSGRYSAATVRGTTWLVQDTCAGTLTRVTEGVVAVKHGKKTVIVRAGNKYLAKRR